jgi:hypothetical protein
MPETATMGRRAWDWIVRHADDFFTPRPVHRRMKIVADLAWIAGTLPIETTGARALLMRAWEEVGRGEAIARALAVEPFAATTYLPFELAGLRSTNLETCLADASWTRAHVEWQPFGRLAIAAVLDRIGIAVSWDTVTDVTAGRFFDRPTSRTSAIRAAFLAHVVMWATAMGRDRGQMKPTVVKRYRTAAHAWHPLLRSSGLLDPLGEIVIADLCLGTEPDPASLELLCDAQCADGSMPPYPHVVSTDFEDLYHPTCVAALAGVLAGPS